MQKLCSVLFIILSASIINSLTAQDFSYINYKSYYSSHHTGSNLFVPITLKTTKNYSNTNSVFNKEIDYTKFAIIGGVVISGGLAVQLYQANAWWSEDRRSFHFTEDWEYALWLDKLGHFYAAAILTHGFACAFEGANFNTEDANIYAAITAMAWQTFVEIEDGFGISWGFSWGDYMFNTAGALFYLGRYYYPFLKNFQPKMSYYPSKNLTEGQTKSIVIDDYEGQKYWMGMRVKEFLPKNLSKYWPSFLMISAGMGIRDFADWPNRKSELYIALDLDVERLPLYGEWWTFIKNAFNFIHFPMPGIRLTNGVAAFAFVY